MEVDPAASLQSGFPAERKTGREHKWFVGTKFCVDMHMGREHASREKKLSLVNFLIFVQKNVSRMRFREIKIRP